MSKKNPVNFAEKVMGDYHRLMATFEAVSGPKGNLIGKSIRRLETLNPFKAKVEQCDPSYLDEMRQAVDCASKFWHLRDGVAMDANFTREFWESTEGRLLSKAQHWLMESDLISRTEALLMIKGLTDSNDIKPTDRVWMHSQLYPRKNKKTKFTIFARDMLSREQVSAYLETPMAQAALEASAKQKLMKDQLMKGEPYAQETLAPDAVEA